METATKINDYENELAELELEFAKDEVATNSARLNELSARQQTIQQELDALYALWEELSEMLSLNF